MSINLYDSITDEMERGKNGKNISIPIKLSKLGQYVEIAKNTMYVLGGIQGCLSKGTKVFMYNGTFKNVEDIQVGDKLMGPDSTPRNVLSLCGGKEQMYWIRQNKGIDYRVNENHILSLRKIGKKIINRRVIPNQLHIKKNKRKRDITYSDNQIEEKLNISVKDYLSIPKTMRERWVGYKVPIEFDEKNLTISPYFFGLWLGDGTSCSPQITSLDKEIEEYLYDYVKSMGCKITQVKKHRYDIIAENKIKRINEITLKEDIFNSTKECSEILNYSKNYVRDSLLTGKYKQKNYQWERVNKDNTFLKFLQEENLLRDKFIPNNFLLNSKENRLQLLAGLIDSDRYNNRNTQYNITFKNETLAKQTVFLSRSLGYYTSIKKKTARMKRKDGSIYSCDVYRIGISSENLYEIPCKIERKKIRNPSTKVSKSLSSGIKIEKDIIDDYYGFNLDGDNLFLLEDFTVSHNSGKSTVVQEVLFLDVIDWWMENKDNTSLKLDIIYFGMERKMFMYIAKWLSRAIFLKQGIDIPYKSILKGKLTSEQESLVNIYKEKLKDWEEIVMAFEGSLNPTGISKFIEEFARKHGEIIPRKDGNLEYKSYKSKYDNHIVLIITDHVGILKPEKVDGKVKQNIDKFSSVMREARDLYGFSPVIVQQLNRGVQDVTRLKLSDILPKLSDFAETSQTSHDADVVLAILDPFSILPEGTPTDFAGYNLQKLKDERYAKFYRSLHILKNSFDSNGVHFPLAFHPYYGIFKDMPKKAKDMTDGDYQGIVNGSYFLTS